MPERQVTAPPTVAAVLFDMDGLLIDSEPVWYEVETAVVARLGGRWTPADQAACLGGTMAASARYIIDRTGTSVTVDELSDELIDEMVTRFRTALPLHDGALELLDAVRDRDVPVGLVSSSYRRLIDAALVGLGGDRFAVTVGGDEVARGKPDPEPYLTACRRLGVDPARTVVLEDAITGVTAAEAAGCVVVAVPSVSPIDALPRRYVVPSLSAIDPDWLVGLAS
jgi:HAD superfamily hydrolase (TIGR01509 family)